MTPYEAIFLIADLHEALRREKRYQEADKVRKSLEYFGFKVWSTKEGFTEFTWRDMWAWDKVEKELG